MPRVHNGIGTWYWSKRNLFTEWGTCGFCSRPAALRSYDTTLYVVVFFLPLIPLGDKRVLRDCPLCKRHRVMPLRVWRQGKAEKLGSLAAAVGAGQEADQRVAARELVGTLLAYQDRAGLQASADTLAARFGADPEVQTDLAEACARLGLVAPAERAYRAVLAARPDAEGARRGLWISLLRQGRAPEALGWLEPDLNPPRPEQVNLYRLQVEGFQAEGRHREALELLDRVAPALTGWAQTKEYARLRQSAQKHLATGRRIASPALVPPRVGPTREPLVTGAFRRLLGPALLLLALLAYFQSALEGGSHHPLYVVNGTAAAYRVLVNDQPLEVPPHGVQKTSVAEGEVRVRPADQSLRGREERFRLETSFWVRPFARRVAVLNPDRTALVVDETVTYVTHGQKAPAPTYQFFAPAFFREYPSVSAPFEELPATVTLSSHSSSTTRDRLFLPTKLTSFGAVELLLGKLGRPAAAAYAQGLVGQNPDDETALTLFTRLADPAAAAAFLRAGLDQRPVAVNWHRFYQNLVQQNEPGRDLRGEYEAAQQREPDEPAWSYLLARVTADPGAARALYERSVQGARPTPYGFLGLSLDELSQGRFPQAWSALRRVVARPPATVSFRHLERECQLANRDYEALLAQDAAARQRAPVNPEPVGETVRLELRRGGEAAARRALDDYREQLRRARTLPAKAAATAGDEEDSETPDAAALAAGEAAAQAAWRYGHGDLAGYGQELAKVPGNRYAFEAALCAGQLPVAAEALERRRADLTRMAQGTPTLEAILLDQGRRADLLYDRLLLSLAGNRVGAVEVARDQLELAGKEAASCLPAEEARFLAALGSGRGTPPRADQLCRSAVLPNRKRVLLTVAGTLFPADRARYFTLARQLNYEPVFPSLLLDQVLAGP